MKDYIGNIAFVLIAGVATVISVKHFRDVMFRAGSDLGYEVGYDQTCDEIIRNTSDIIRANRSNTVTVPEGE